MRLHRQDLLENIQKGEKQNILIVAEAYYPLIGGATVVADNLAKEYAKTCNVAVVTGDCRYEDKAEYPVIRCTGIGQGSNGTLPLPALENEGVELVTLEQESAGTLLATLQNRTLHPVTVRTAQGGEETLPPWQLRRVSLALKR